MADTTQKLPPWAADVLATLPPLLSRELAAKTADCSPKTIDRRARDGSLKTVRNGGRVLIPRLSFVEFLAGGA